jgi:hypothetical protein
MTQVNEAQKRLIEAGYTVDLRSPYRELTILDAKYDDVKTFLREKGYEGDIIVIGKLYSKTAQKRVKDVGGIEKYPNDIQTRNRPASAYNDKQSEINGEYGQMTIFDFDGGVTQNEGIYDP